MQEILGSYEMGSSLEESTGGGQYILHYAGDPRSRGEGQYSVQEESTGGGQSSLKPEYRVTQQLPATTASSACAP